MKITEVLFEYKNEFDIEYRVIREVTNDSIVVTVQKVLSDNKYLVLSTIMFDNVGCEYKSKYISWYNLIMCSNGYGISPDYEYMNYSVQNGKKLAATVYINGKSEFDKIVRTLPNNCDIYYNPKESEAIAYVCRKGKLSDFYDLQTVKEIYHAHIHENVIKWKQVDDWFNKDIIAFGNNDKKITAIQNTFGVEESVIIGLLLGYPVESTIAYIKKIFI